MGLKKLTSSSLHTVRERGHPRDMLGLIAQLGSTDPHQRRWAARDLAQQQECAPNLGKALSQERDSSVRQALFTSLAAMGSEDAAKALIPLLRSEDAALRNGAIETLASMPSAIAPSITRLLQDGDPDVRLFTVNLLGELRHADVNRWLVQVLNQEPHVNVVAAAIEVLAETGSRDERGALIGARDRFPDDPFIAFSADLALQRMEAS